MPQPYSGRVAHTFAPDVITAVLHHMNDDHEDDSILIARAFSPAASGDVTAAVMTGFDGDGGTWQVWQGADAVELRVPWPSGPIDDRPSVRREIVALYDAACARLGVEPRPHA